MGNLCSGDPEARRLAVLQRKKEEYERQQTEYSKNFLFKEQNTLYEKNKHTESVLTQAYMGENKNLIDKEYKWGFKPEAQLTQK